MSKLDDVLKRFEQVATLGMRESDYIKVDDSLAWFREDLEVVKTALSKKDELLGLYCEHHKLVPFTPGLGDKSKRVLDISIEIKQLEKELGEIR